MLPTRLASADEGLVRAIGTRALAANIVNTTVGAGIFVLPATVAAAVGTAAPLAYLACAVTMALIVTCFAAAGSRVSLTGGLYAYVETAFGPYAGFMAGVLYWLSAVLGAATVAVALVAAVGVAWPAVGAGIGRAAFLVAVFGCLAWENWRGVSIGSRVAEIATVAKLVPLVIFLAAGVFFLHPAFVRPELPPGATEMGGSVLALVFAFVGIEVALVPSGEVVEPARTVPRAIYAALVVTTLLYLAIQFVAQGLLGPELARSTAAPLASAAAVALGRAGASMLVAAAAISMAGYLAGDALGSPRVLFAFGRDRLLPGVFARLHPVYRTPTTAIAVHIVVACALAVAGSFGRLLLMTNVATLSLYLMCCAASWQLARRDVREGGTPFTVPGGALIPALACAAILWILWHATREEFEVEGVVLLIATAVYAMRMKR